MIFPIKVAYEPFIIFICYGSSLTLSIFDCVLQIIISLREQILIFSLEWLFLSSKFHIARIFYWRCWISFCKGVVSHAYFVLTLCIRNFFVLEAFFLFLSYLAFIFIILELIPFWLQAIFSRQTFLTNFF